MKRMMLLLSALAALVLACSVKPPEVRFTGEKTALEREVVGTYESMTEDTWMIASTRSTHGGNQAKVSPEKKKVLAALRQQKFNKDDIDELKKKGVIGENNQGFLEVRPDASDNAETRTLAEDLVKEENSDREVIMGRVIELNASLQKTVREEVLTIFAKMNRENTIDGTWIQMPDGTWTQK